MRHIAHGIVIVALGICVASAGDEGPDRPATPAGRYNALLKEYQEASGGGALTDEERLKFIGRVYRHRNKLSLQFIDLAEKHPMDPIAVDALMQAVWQVNGTPWPVELVGKDDGSARALALLERHYIGSDRLGPTCQRLSYGFCSEYEPFLRAVLEKSPHHNVRGEACLALAHFLMNRQQRIDLVSEQPELAREFAGLYGEKYLRELQRQERGQALEEAESLFERAAEKYGAVNLPDGDTVGEKATTELFEMRHLVVGKEAPDIEGEDQDGKTFKLSDYRGKVVLLDFWSEY